MIQQLEATLLATCYTGQIQTHRKCWFKGKLLGLGGETALGHSEPEGDAQLLELGGDEDGGLVLPLLTPGHQTDPVQHEVARHHEQSLGQVRVVLLGGNLGLVPHGDSHELDETP